MRGISPRGPFPTTRLAANLARTNQVWLLSGNAGTSPSSQFLGTTDNQPLTFRVNGSITLKLGTNHSVGMGTCTNGDDYSVALGYLTAATNAYALAGGSAIGGWGRLCPGVG